MAEKTLTLSSMLSTIQNTNWTKINNYSIELTFASDAFKGIVGFTSTNEDINKSLITVNTPALQNQAVEQYVGFEWKYHQGRDELYRFEMTFRDYDKFTMFNQFKNLYNKSKDQYFDKICLNIAVFSEDDKDGTRAPIFSTSTAIVTAVSQLQFSHSTDNQIAEFTVNFACKPIEHHSGDTIGGKLDSGVSTPGAGANGTFNYNKK